MRLALKSFPFWLEKNGHADAKHNLDDVMDELGEMVQNLCQESSTRLLEQIPFITTTEMFSKYLDF